MKIRLGTFEDMESIARLHANLNQMMSQLQPNDFKSNSEDAAWIKQYLLDENSDYLLVEDGGEIRGLALVEESESYNIPSLLKRHYANLIHLIVAPDYRGVGYGHELMEAVKQWGKERQLEYIELSVLANNQAALLFYEKEGLIDVRKVMRASIA